MKEAKKKINKIFKITKILMNKLEFLINTNMNALKLFIKKYIFSDIKKIKIL